MSDLQTKFGGGLNKIQGSLQQGKQKLITVQEISTTKKSLQEMGDQRANVMIKLGEETYKLIRNGIINNTTLNPIIQSIPEMDIKIFQFQQALDHLNKKEQENSACTACGTHVTTDDKFCGGCGAPVELQPDPHTDEEKECTACSMPVPVTADYCGCCGVKFE